MPPDLIPQVTETQHAWLLVFLLMFIVCALILGIYRIIRQWRIEEAIIETRDILKEIRDQQKNRS